MKNSFNSVEQKPNTRAAPFCSLRTKRQKSVSMSDHLMFEDIGRAKIAAKVRLFFEFIDDDTIIWYQEEAIKSEVQSRATAGFASVPARPVHLQHQGLRTCVRRGVIGAEPEFLVLHDVAARPSERK